ncbi:FAD-binding protein [Nocardioides ginkgobilobae]
MTSGGIGGNHELVRKAWPERLGTPPERMVSGVPAHVDGRMLEITAAAGGAVINPDRMWHYTEGLRNWDPICGTTPRDCATGTRSGTTTASASCPARRRCGSTPRATGSPRRTSPASTPSARWGTSWPPATTTPGSC